ncbi:MAG TPA: hypothetical protein VH253_09000 [Phycisphaerae bacterium]|nr:hypothetical protein [Phycisphaerae bacterium]
MPKRHARVWMASLAIGAACRFGVPIAAQDENTPPGITETQRIQTQMDGDAIDRLNKATDDALDAPMASFTFTGTLEEALKAFGTAANVHMDVRWKSLEAAGIQSSAPISVDLAKIPTARVLAEILNEAGGATATLNFTVMDNQVLVSTADDLTGSRYSVVRMYDIGLLIPDAGDEASVQELIDTIETVIAPDTWRDKGGQLGSIRVLESKLIISQTRENHRAVAAMLTKLKADKLDQTRMYDVRDLLQPEAAPIKSPEQKEKDTKALLEAIETTCGRGTWVEAGGTQSSAAIFDGRLYVKAPNGVHEEIEHLLGLMHKK